LTESGTAKTDQNKSAHKRDDMNRWSCWHHMVGYARADDLFP
jgi:hypothetical protein